MATITVTVDDEIEARFRAKALQKFGKKKGTLGKAFNSAMDKWVESEKDDATEETLKMLEKGFDMGKLKYKSRDELHER